MEISKNPITLEKHLQKWGMKKCPIDNSLRIFQQKFALNIIRNMMLLKHTRFSQFLGSVEGINTKTLSVRLREMEDYGLIKRKVTQKRPLQVEYTLTEMKIAQLVHLFCPILYLILFRTVFALCI